MRSLEASGVEVAADLEEALVPAIDAFRLRYALISSCYKGLLSEGYRAYERDSSHVRQEGEYS